MMLPYPKKKDTPNRKNRKSARNKIYWQNYKMKKVEKAKRREFLFALVGQRQERFESVE